MGLMAYKRNRTRPAELSDICASRIIVLNDEVKRETSSETNREEEPIKKVIGIKIQKLGNKKHKHLPLKRFVNG